MHNQSDYAIDGAGTVQSGSPADSPDTKSTGKPAEPPRAPGFGGIVGKSVAMKDLFRLIKRVADSDSTILVNGETGTGKGLAAKVIHRCSYRRNKPFVSINCGAIPENLLESELFGHVKGAFTGATNAKIGKFEAADGGTIFLDEIGDMSPDLQVKVLKVLEEREFEPVGGCKPVKVNVRIIAATHRDLEEEVQKGNFREDLFYRLYVIPVRMPALRERAGDIAVLAKYFSAKLNYEKRLGIEGINEEAMGCLLRHDWPGNVRELANLMERMAVLKGEGVLGLEDLPPKMKAGVVPQAAAPVAGRPNAKAAASEQEVDGAAASALPLPLAFAAELDLNGMDLSTAVSEFEKSLIYQSLEKTDWVKNRAAQLLQVKRTTLVEKIKRYELQKCA